MTRPKLSAGLECSVCPFVNRFPGVARSRCFQKSCNSIGSFWIWERRVQLHQLLKGFRSPRQLQENPKPKTHPRLSPRGCLCCKPWHTHTHTSKPPDQESTGSMAQTGGQLEKLVDVQTIIGRGSLPSFASAREAIVVLLTALLRAHPYVATSFRRCQRSHLRDGSEISSER